MRETDTSKAVAAALQPLANVEVVRTVEHVGDHKNQEIAGLTAVLMCAPPAK